MQICFHIAKTVIIHTISINFISDNLEHIQNDFLFDRNWSFFPNHHKHILIVLHLQIIYLNILMLVDDGGVTEDVGFTPFISAFR